MTGEMKGGMRKAKSLYLKGSMPSDVRDEALFVNNPSLFINNPRLFVNKIHLLLENTALMPPIVPLLGTNYSQTGKKTFPA